VSFPVAQSEQITSFIQPADKERIRQFVNEQVVHLVKPAPTEIWHYTDASGLLGILKSGGFWFTQSTCLNDIAEQRYLGDQVHGQVKEQLSANPVEPLSTMLRAADVALTDRDFSTTWHHVACFSAVEDDLGQWRGYGGGECGYAIGFDTRKLNAALKQHRGEAVFVKMIYDAAEHERLAKETLKFGLNLFTETIGQNIHIDARVAAGLFLEEFAVELDILATMTKHPTFFREEEWRMVAAFQEADFKNLEFRQKRTLLARYLPITLVTGEEKLPITRICVGPGPAQRVSQISVDAVLRKYNYPETKVEISKVPFRIA
jgi:hypothetical protein